MTIPDISEVEQHLEHHIADQRIILQRVRRFQNVEQGTIIAKTSEAYLADIIQYDRLRGTRVMGVEGSGIFVAQIESPSALNILDQKISQTILNRYPEQFRRRISGRLLGLRKDYGNSLDLDVEEIFIGEKEVSEFIAPFGFTLDDYTEAVNFYKTIKYPYAYRTNSQRVTKA